jgi:GNAT superfamily N-acetyltransferase
MYVDDLVTDETKRSTGVGHALMEHLQAIARERGCTTYTLDSGTQRQQAHKFYFREGMVVQAFHFTKPMG